MNWTCLFFCAVCVLVQFGNSAADNSTTCGECCKEDYWSKSQPVNVTCDAAANKKFQAYLVCTVCSLKPGSYVTNYTVGNETAVDNTYDFSARFFNQWLGWPEEYEGSINCSDVGFRGKLKTCDGRTVDHTAQVQETYGPGRFLTRNKNIRKRLDNDGCYRDECEVTLEYLVVEGASSNLDNCTFRADLEKDFRNRGCTMGLTQCGYPATRIHSDQQIYRNDCFKRSQVYTTYQR